jgi:hypothetical protein
MKIFSSKNIIKKALVFLDSGKNADERQKSWTSKLYFAVKFLNVYG